MPEMPANTLLGYIGTVFFLFGIFLILAGLGVIKVQQVTVSMGAKTLILGIIIAMIGGILVFSDSRKSINVSTATGSQPTTSPTPALSLNPQLSITTLSNPIITPNDTTITDQEVVTIKLGEEKPTINNAITISLDYAFNANSISISVRSLGYPRQTYETLRLGDKVIFHGSNDYEILIADFKDRSGLFSTNIEIQVVVKKLSLLDYTPTPENTVQEIVMVKASKEVNVFDGEIIIEFQRFELFNNYRIKIRSIGYISEGYNVVVGSRITYKGKYDYTIVVTNYSDTEGLEFTVSKQIE